MMAGSFIPLMSLMFSFMFMITLVQYNPSLAAFGTFAAASISFLKLNYERKTLPRYLMDVLDRLTNRANLETAYLDRRDQHITIDSTELANRLKARVIGQDACAERVANQLRRRFAARLPDKPIAVFCLAGPPGVGKTYFAKVLSEELFGDKQRLKFFDMSQFGEPHAAASLFGQARGYVGSTSYGSLTATLRDEPRSLILLDEFEKAHPEVHKRFLTAWNDGFVTEVSDGAKISTSDAIFIMTTNAATRRIGEIAKDAALEQDDQDRLVKQALLDAGFVPELLSRIDTVFAFSPIEGLNIARVVALEIEKLTKQFGLGVADKGIEPAILLDAIKHLQGRTNGGVRDIVRAIEQDITDGLIDARATGAKTIRLTAVGEKVRVDIADLNLAQLKAS